VVEYNTMANNDEASRIADSLTRISAVCNNNVAQSTADEQVKRKDREDAKLATLSERGCSPWYTDNK